MCDIIAAKLQQHPQLCEAVRKRGGVAFLEKCEHFTGAQQRASGRGRASGVSLDSFAI